ncbi:MAG: hypothetical protein LBD31_02955 [Treponema sp.]|jgi:hypothetical protein|nr:hypothetical protein [Treponema sp.]
MDARHRVVRELNEKRRENLLFRAQTLEDLGQSLAERLGEEALPGTRGEEYRRFKQEISGSEASIEAIRGALERIRELDEEISVKRFEKKDREEEAGILYEGLGRRILEGSSTAVEELSAGLGGSRRQADALADREAVLEERLHNLEKPGAGFLAWLSGLFQGIGIRGALKRIRRQTDRLYRQAGEAYASTFDGAREGEDGTEDGAGGDKPPEESGGPGILLRDTLEIRKILAELDGAVDLLEREKTRIQASFDFREGPLRRIRLLEEQIRRRRKDLRELCFKVGEEAGALPPECLEPGDVSALDKARRCGESAEKTGREIERIEAEIAIDQERDRIAKLERAVYGQRNRAADSERIIAELNRKIAGANRRIEELQNRNERAE